MNEIEVQISKKGLKKKYVASYLGMRPETLSRKLKNPETFSAEQMAGLSQLLEKDISKLNFHVTFFKNKLELNSS